jgi:glycosyltransferase involved in cell wall biosynthesis
VLTVVMPAYNEAAFLEQSVHDVAAGLGARGEPYEILVVENGSTDGTLDLARRLATEDGVVRALHRPAPDYGDALRAGLLDARGDVVVNFDVDYYDLEFLADAVDRVRVPGGPSIVVASKRGEGSTDERPLRRRLVTLTFSALLHAGFGLGVSDTHGMKAMRRADVVGLAEQCRFGIDLFDTELILRAERAGLAVAELPAHVEERRPARTSIWARVPRTLWGLVRLRFAIKGWRPPRPPQRDPDPPAGSAPGTRTDPPVQT